MATARSRHRALRRAAEMAAVFLGVALAFVAENFREDLQDRAAAADLASALLEDLEVSLADLVEIRERSQRQTTASLEAREHLRSPVPTVAIDSLSELLTIGSAIDTQRPVLRSYDQLVATGLLIRLEPDIRNALAEWVTSMDMSRDYFERELLDFRQNVAFPFWARSVVSFEQMLRRFRTNRAGVFDGLELGEPRFPHTWEDLHESRELNDVLVEFAVLSESAERGYRLQEETLVRLIELLREEYR